MLKARVFKRPDNNQQTAFYCHVSSVECLWRNSLVFFREETNLQRQRIPIDWHKFFSSRPTTNDRREISLLNLSTVGNDIVPAFRENFFFHVDSRK